MKTRFLKIRLVDERYQHLKARAGEAGQPISSFARDVLTAEADAVQQAVELAQIKSQIQELVVRVQMRSPVDPALRAALQETLLLVRELAMDRNAQILSRVRAQLTPSISLKETPNG